MSDVLDRLGYTEADFQAMIVGRQNAKRIIVRVPANVYSAAQEIRHQLHNGYINEGLAQILWEQKVRPHIPLRAGVDFDPAHDLICVEPALPARHIITPA